MSGSKLKGRYQVNGKHKEDKMEKQTLGEIAAQKLLGMIQEKAIRPEISCPRKRSWWNFWVKNVSVWM